MAMTSKERVLAAISHRESDRVPFNLRPGPEILEWFRSKCGEAADFAEHFNHDVRIVPLKLPERPSSVRPTDWTPFPDAQSVEALKRETQSLQERGLAVCGGYQCGIFEQAKEWLGDEAALTAPFEDASAFGALLDRIAEWKEAVYGAYCSAGVDIVWMGDDLGTQRSLVMSPEQYRELYRPRHRRIVERLKSMRSDVKIAFHCCGHVAPLIPDLIEIGIDILEAVQAEAMDIAGLKREFGRDLTFWGGVGAQSVLARATPEKVLEGVRGTLSIMAPGGGYIAAPCHTLTAEVPWDNVVAFHKALELYGAYPIRG